MSDLIAAKKARLEKLKKDAADKKLRRDKNKTGDSVSASQGGTTDDINDLIEKAVSSSAFEERKKKEEDRDEPITNKIINTSLTVALDQ